MELLVVVVVLAVGSFAKGLTGSGLPQLAIPVMALFLGVERAVIIMSIPGVFSNVWLVWLHRRASSQSRDLPVLLVTGTVGAVAGTVLLTTVDGRWLASTLATLIVVYVVLRVRRPHALLSRSASFWTSPPVGLAAGAFQGATGISGPLLATYLHAFGLVPAVYLFSLSSLFLVFAVTQVATLAVLGAYTTTLLGAGLLALVPVALMMPVGSWVSRRLDPARFSRLIMVTLVAAALALVWRAFA